MKPLLLWPLKVDPTAPASPSHSQRWHSGLHSPIRVTSATRSYTASGVASISVLTSAVVGALMARTLASDVALVGRLVLVAEVPALALGVVAKDVLGDEDLVHLVRAVGDAQRAGAHVHPGER